MNKYIIKIIFFIITSTALYSQSIEIHKDTSILNQEGFTTNLENNLNSAIFKSNLYKNIRSGKIIFSIDGYYNSDVTKLGENFARDNINISLKTNYILSKRFYAGVGVQSKSLSDEKNIEVNKTKSMFYFANFEYTNFDNFKVNTKIGIKNDEQTGKVTSGFSGIILTEIDRFIIYDINTSGKLNVSYENLIQKKNHFLELNTNLYKSFTVNADNNLNIRVYNTKNDFFVPATQSIISQYNENLNTQSRMDNYVILQDELNYRFLKNFGLTISGIYLYKNYRNEYKYKPQGNSAIFENIYDTKVNENRVEGFAKISFFTSKLNTSFKLLFSERAEVHSLINAEDYNPATTRELERIEKNKNNSASISSAVLSSDYNLSNLHSINLSSSYFLLRYDTDSEENLDDRDELYINAQISHTYNNLSDFKLTTLFEFNMSTLNYIFKERSANNSTNKIFRLNSRSTYSPLKNLLTINSFQVLANYTVYRFEDMLSQVQSYVFRQLQIWDSTSFDITKNVFTNINGELKIYEQGQFNEKKFSIKPSDYFVEKRIDVNLNYKYEFLTFGVGFKFFILDQYEYESGEKRLKYFTQNFGPYSNITLSFYTGTLVYLMYSKDFLKSKGNYENKSDNFIIKVFLKL